MTHVDVQAKATKTAAFDGSSIDISAITGDWTLVLEILGQNDGNTTRWQFTDSVDAFSASIAGPTFSVSGQIGSGSTTVLPQFRSPKRFTIQKRDFPSLRFGTASAVLRLSLTEITGSSKSVTYQAWIEY